MQMQRRTFLRVALTSAGALFVGVHASGCSGPKPGPHMAPSGNLSTAEFLTIEPDDISGFQYDRKQSSHQTRGLEVIANDVPRLAV